jgi:hypothetical protein
MMCTLGNIALHFEIFIFSSNAIKIRHSYSHHSVQAQYVSVLKITLQDDSMHNIMS